MNPAAAADLRRSREPGTVALVQLGCEKNTVDGERLLGELARAGWRPLAAVTGGYRSPASLRIFSRVDLLIVNTCAFIAAARRESLAAIRAALRKKRRGEAGRVAVAGCHAEDLHASAPAALKAAVDLWIGPGDIACVARLVAAMNLGMGHGDTETRRKHQDSFSVSPCLGGEKIAIKRRVAPVFAPAARSLLPGPRILSRANGTAFLKIAEGCDRECAFCTIPRLRGPMVSKPVAAVIAEARALLAAGARELVLVAQDTTAWGRDREENLPALLRRFDRLGRDQPPFWLRLLYLHPALVTERLLAAMQESAVTVPYLDLPFQHASPRVLAAMRRPGGGASFLRLIERIRSRFAECAVRATVMVGHPGESAREFRVLANFVRAAEFDRLGVFAYSAEPGTAAGRRRAPPASTAAQRAQEIIARQREISARRLAARVGRDYAVLMDRPEQGRSALEAPDVDGVIRLPGVKTAGFVRARIIRSGVHDLTGEIQPCS